MLVCGVLDCGARETQRRVNVNVGGVFQQVSSSTNGAPREGVDRVAPPPLG